MAFPVLLLVVAALLFGGLTWLRLGRVPLARRARVAGVVIAVAWGAGVGWEIFASGFLGHLRIDILVVYPALLGVSIAALAVMGGALWATRRRL